MTGLKAKPLGVWLPDCLSDHNGYITCRAADA
jgi:hypothetical protein